MTWDGKMQPCGTMPGPVAYPLEDGFCKAWKQIREQTNLIRLPKQCANCNMRPVCGVCAAVCVAETGKFDQVPEYKCEQTKESIRLACEGENER